MCPSGRELALARSKPGFRSAFEVLDADHDGKISREDLQMFYAGFSSNGIVAAAGDDDIIGSMMSVADFNKDGFVEYEEFERVLGDVEAKNKKKKNGSTMSNSYGVMGDAFKVMDKDGDGKLSHGDLKSYMQWAGFDASDEDIKAMIKLGGGDEKDGVDFDGLLKILAVNFVC